MSKNLKPNFETFPDMMPKDLMQQILWMNYFKNLQEENDKLKKENEELKKEKEAVEIMFPEIRCHYMVGLRNNVDIGNICVGEFCHGGTKSCDKEGCDNETCGDHVHCYSCYNKK